MTPILKNCLGSCLGLISTETTSTQTTAPAPRLENAPARHAAVQEGAPSSSAIDPKTLGGQPEKSAMQKKLLKMNKKRPSPLEIGRTGAASSSNHSRNVLQSFQQKPFIRFNEIANALEGLRDIPVDVRNAIEAQSQAATDDHQTLSTLVRAYSRGNSVTTYTIGEALAEMIGSGRLSPSNSPLDSGEICKVTLARERKKDPALDLLMGHLLMEDGEVRPADSPLPRNIKEAHSVEYMRLCSRSSRRPKMNMPATRAVIDELKPQQPFADVHVFQAQHAFDHDETQARGLFELGLKPKKLSYFPKTGARALVLDRLSRMGVQMYDNAYDLRHSRNPVIEPLVEFLDQSFGLTGMPLEQQIKQLRTYADGSSDHSKPNILLVDEGFKVGKALITLQQSDDAQMREKYRIISNLCPMVAHTEGDIIKGGKALAQAEQEAIAQGKPAPILPRTINMAQSPAKKFEGFSIGQDVWLATNQLLDMIGEPEAIAQRPKETLLLGYGVVAAKAQPQLQSGHDVYIWDIDPKALLQAYKDQEANSTNQKTGKLHIPVDRATLERVVARGGARDDEELVKALAASKKEWFSHGHMVVSNTGAPSGSLRANDFEFLPDGAILTSGASGDYEFGTTSGREKNPHLARLSAKEGRVDFPLAGAGSNAISMRTASGDHAYFDHQVYETHSQTSNAKRFMILRGGYAVNRLYGTPPPFMDTTKAIMIRSMYEAIQPHNDDRPQSGLWLVEPDHAAQNRIIDTVNTNLATNSLGTLDEPDFTNVDPHWHRPAVPASPHPSEPGKSEGYTSERFVQSGIAACKTYNISPLSFALICNPGDDLAHSQDLRMLQQEISSATTSDGLSTETARPQRTIAHTLYAVFAREAAEPMDGIDAEVNAARTQLGIDDQQWADLLNLRDDYGMSPADYSVLPSPDATEAADDLRKGRELMQECISTISIGAPTQEQLRGDPLRRERVMDAIRPYTEPAS
ncbi:MAG TPA: hypothetical protein VM571_14710 [Noviherbaspirillum sp.]|nr:hypothetical protein [Noviherbaspirillum sp.]